MTRKFQYIPRDPNHTDEQHLEEFIKKKYRNLDAKTDTEKFVVNEMKIVKDIYCYAYVAMIHPMEVEQLDPKKKYLPRIFMLNEERSSLYIGAITVTIVQMITVSLIYQSFEDNHMQIKPTSSIYILVPRLVSSIMMHLNVEPDIRQGIQLMKYAINHPWKFRTIKQGHENEDINTVQYSGVKRRVFCAFLLGLSQATVGIVAEILVIVYLSSLSNLLKIIMKYVSLAAVVKFDNMYAATLYNHAI